MQTKKNQKRRNNLVLKAGPSWKGYLRPRRAPGKLQRRREIISRLKLSIPKQYLNQAQWLCIWKLHLMIGNLQRSKTRVAVGKKSKLCPKWWRIIGICPTPHTILTYRISITRTHEPCQLAITTQKFRGSIWSLTKQITFNRAWETYPQRHPQKVTHTFTTSIAKRGSDNNKSVCIIYFFNF